MSYNENYEEFLERFCENLKEVLKEKELTQRAQTLAGFDPRYMARLKKGERNPTLMTLWRVAQIAEIDPSRLLKIRKPVKK